MKRKKKLYKADVLRLLVALVALSVLLYPVVSNYLYEKNSTTIADNYDESALLEEPEELQKMWEAAEAYNQTLLGIGTGSFADVFRQTAVDEEKNAVYEGLLNLRGDGMMGYITIPKLDVRLPIYHSTEEAVLQVGVGHFPSSSLPVGGESTHTVLTGHRGLPSKKLFTDLDQIEEGDIFYLKILNHTLAYQVDQILTVLPEETEALAIEEGKDYATLVTCTPYAINTRRLLIRGHRIPYDEAKAAEETLTGLRIPAWIRALLIAACFLPLAPLLEIMTWRLRRRLKKIKRRGRK